MQHGDRMTPFQNTMSRHISAFETVPSHLVDAIRGYCTLPPFRGRLVWSLPIRNVGGVAVSRDNEVFVTICSLGIVEVYALDGTRLRQWGSFGPAPGQLNHPRGIAVTKHDEVVVADYNNDRVQVFRTDGTFVRQLQATFKFPQAVAVNDRGWVFVAHHCEWVFVCCVKTGRMLDRFKLERPPGGFPLNWTWPSVTSLHVFAKGILVCVHDKGSIITRYQVVSSTRPFRINRIQTVMRHSMRFEHTWCMDVIERGHATVFLHGTHIRVARDCVSTTFELAASFGVAKSSALCNVHASSVSRNGRLIVVDDDVDNDWAKFNCRLMAFE